MAKLFLVLDGIRDDVALSGDVQIDEKHHPVARADERPNADGSRRRGLSRDKLCVAIGRDAEGRSPFATCGRGKPSKARAWDAYGAHMAECILQFFRCDVPQSVGVPFHESSVCACMWNRCGRVA